MAAACTVFAVGVAPASALTTNLADIEINEVESNDDSVNGDWIELYNTGALVNDEVDLSGAILSDNDNSHRFVIPNGTHLAKEAWIAFRVDNPAVPGNFGLGSADSARLFPANTVNLGAVSPTDIYTWTSHAPTTYGANPDGSDDFEVTAVGTFGDENNFDNPSIRPITGVKLNEIESNGDGVHGDWVELYNTTGSAINIDGAIITDNDPAHQFVVPDSTPDLAAGGYVAFEVESEFGLGSDDAARLYAPGDVTLSAVVDEHAWSNHATVTWGRDVAGAGAWVQTAVSTFGAPNQFSAVAIDNLTGVVINEVESHGDDTDGDWIELKNGSGSSVTLDGAILSDNDNGHVFRIPDPTPNVADTTLAAGAVKAYRVDDPALGNAEFGLGDNDSARLFRSNTVDLNTTPVDDQSWATHAVRTYGLDGTGTWTSTNKGTFDGPNDFSTAITPDISDVVLNEVVTTADAIHGDWVELLNTTGSSIDISNAIITDGVGNPFTIPASTTLAAGDTYVLQTENAGFGLGKRDGVRLYRAGASTGSIPVDHHEWDDHPVANPLLNPFASYARQSNGFGDWITDTTPSYDAAN